MRQVPETTEHIGVRPAHLHVVQPTIAARVAAPAYDLLPAGVRPAPTDDPLSYLNVLAPPAGAAPLRHSRRALQRLLRDGVFDGGTEPRFAWYRLAVTGHVQTGLIAEVRIRDYDEGRIARHEHTRADREEQLAVFQQEVSADASPVALAFRADHHMRALTRRATAGRPFLQFTADDGVEHTLWVTVEPADVEEIASATNRLERLYVTDGHHRLAAASRMAAAGRLAGAGPDATDQWVLAALFADDELRILPFHRAIARPSAIPTARLLADLATHATVVPAPRPEPPAHVHEFTMWLDGGWYRVDVGADAIRPPPLGALPVTVLHESVIVPLFGVLEPRIDPRLTYVAGDADEVAAHCEHHSAIGFMVRPTTMEQLMAVADADAVMPPKSTLFTPKTRAGIVLRLIG